MASHSSPPRPFHLPCPGPAGAPPQVWSASSTSSGHPLRTGCFVQPFCILLVTATRAPRWPLPLGRPPSQLLLLLSATSPLASSSDQSLLCAGCLVGSCRFQGTQATTGWLRGSPHEHSSHRGAHCWTHVLSTGPPSRGEEKRPDWGGGRGQIGGGTELLGKASCLTSVAELEGEAGSPEGGRNLLPRNQGTQPGEEADISVSHWGMA